jgi:PAS domain S-box-containing protein
VPRLGGSPDASAERLDAPVGFEALLTDLSSRFIYLPPDQVDHEIEESLQRVCSTLALDLGVLWQWDAQGEVINPTHAYPPLAVLPIPDDDGRGYPWTVQEIRGGRTIVLPSLDDLPAGAVTDGDSARKVGIKSNVTLPLTVGGSPPVGALAFSTLRAERAWPESLVMRLRLVGQVFSNALARKRSDEALRASEQRLSLAVEFGRAGLWTLDYSTGVFWATDQSRAIFGFAPDQVITMEALRAIVVAEDWHLIAEAIGRAAATGDFVDVEYRFHYRDEPRPRWITARGQPTFRPDGAADTLVGICFDITERRQAVDALHTSEARLAAGAQLAGLGFYEVDYAGQSMYLDPRTRECLGVPDTANEGLQGVHFWESHVRPEDRALVSGLRQQLHAGLTERLSVEYRYAHPERGEVWLQHRAEIAARDASGAVARSYGVIRDVTEFKRVEDEMRDLSRRLIRAQEEERALIARELHDDVTQRLAVLAIDVGRAESVARSSGLSTGLHALREELVRLSEDIHTLAYQLHPSVLQELGLVEALRVECERRGNRHGLHVNLDLMAVPEGLPREAAMCLFRVAQESLTNVGRHAAARTVTVTLRGIDQGLLLAVRDDGVGFDPTIPRRPRLGLASMRERMRLVNGTLEVESAPGQGTTVMAWAPLHGERQ